MSRDSPPPLMLCGFHAVATMLAKHPRQVQTVWLAHRRRDVRMQKLRAQLRDADIRIRDADDAQLAQLASGLTHQGVVAEVQSRAPLEQAELLARIDAAPTPVLLLILDQLQDPHNLGACLRVADGVGVDAVILPKDGACRINATVARVAAGALAGVPVCRVANLARMLDALKQRGVWLTGGADSATHDIHQCDFRPPSAVVLGSEGVGLRRLTAERCDRLARIPMAGVVASLNVSVAAGVVLYEAMRQRGGLLGNPATVESSET